MKTSFYNFLRSLVKKHEKSKKARIIYRLRREMDFWGIDLSGYSDEEIESGIQRSAGILSQTGLSADQATDALMDLSVKFNNLHKC